MSAVWMRARAELRASWVTWVILTLLLGVLGGLVIAVAAGARRNHSAYPRLLDASHSLDALVPNFGTVGGGAEIDLAKAARLPEVVESQSLVGYEGILGNDIASAQDFVTVVDGPWQISKPKILDGRLPTEAGEVAISTFQLAKLHTSLGQTLRMNFLRAGSSPENPVPVPIAFRVVGVIVSPGDFPTSGDFGALNVVAPSFAARYGDKLLRFTGLDVRLRNGQRDFAHFSSAVQRLSNGPSFVFSQQAQAAQIERSFRFTSASLWILAGLAAIAMALVFGQLLARQISLESNEHPFVRALGMTQGQLFSVALVRALFAALAAACIAVVVAFLASPIFPIGGARIAEPHIGFSFDAFAIGLGAAFLVALTALIAAVPAWRAARARAAEFAGAKHPSFVANGMAAASAPPTVVAGVRLALEPGHGRTAVPVRTTLVGVTIGLAAVIAALTFSASMGHLLSTPRLYGVGWDAEIDAPSLGGNEASSQIEPVVAALPGVDAVAVGGVAVPAMVDGVAADALAMNEIRGSILPPLKQGRQPQDSNEVALGSKTLTMLHKRIGDSVTINFDGLGAAPFRIVGTAVLPPIGDNGAFGKGIVTLYSGVLRAAPKGPPPNAVLVRFSSPGAKRAGLAVVRSRISFAQVYPAARPSDIVDFGRVRSLPLILGGLLAALASATLAHALVTAVRRRRRDLAVLKTLGFVRGQVRRTVAWQASSLGLVTLIIALPAGAAAGRWLWNLVAAQLGILPEPVVPLARLALVVPAVIVLALIVSALPARAAARTKPALVLRTE